MYLETFFSGGRVGALGLGLWCHQVTVAVGVQFRQACAATTSAGVLLSRIMSGPVRHVWLPRSAAASFSHRISACCLSKHFNAPAYENEHNGLSRLSMGSATPCRQALGDPHVHIAISCCVGYSTPDPLRGHGTAV